MFIYSRFIRYLHKGAVIISLDEASDYYKLYLINKEGVRKVAEDLDFTQLGETIDRAIEKGDNEEDYMAFCEQERIKLITGKV